MEQGQPVHPLCSHPYEDLFQVQRAYFPKSSVSRACCGAASQELYLLCICPVSALLLFGRVYHPSGTMTGLFSSCGEGMKMELRHLAPSHSGKSHQVPCGHLSFRLGFTLSAFCSSLLAAPEASPHFPLPL